MQWRGDVIACFATGLFLANGIPHFVKGICGDRFPTPFAKPRGCGLSSPTVNVVWGMVNFLVALVLAHYGDLLNGPRAGRWLAGGAAAALAVGASRRFARKAKE
jgi:hypothetical protein